MADNVLDVFDLTGRTAVITGGASGIGEATCEVLAAQGANVVVADLNIDGATAVAERITAAGGTAVAHETNITKKADLQAAVDVAVDTWGGLDVMANVAGIAHEAPVADITEEDLDKLLAINLKGTIFGCQAAIPAMKASGGGSIINVASSSIDVAAPNYGLYAATKAAIAQLTMTMTWEVGRHGIRVNTIAPGATVTPFTARHAFNEDGSPNPEKMDEFVERMRRISPIGRVGEAIDQAWLIMYLASDAARFCTGQLWRANGGQAIVR